MITARSSSERPPRVPRSAWFWGRAMFATVVVAFGFIVILSFVFVGNLGQGVYGVSRCVDYPAGSHEVSACTSSTIIGPGSWIVLIASALAFLYFGYRVIRAGIAANRR